MGVFVNTVERGIVDNDRILYSGSRGNKREILLQNNMVLLCLGSCIDVISVHQE